MKGIERIKDAIGRRVGPRTRVFLRRALPFIVTISGVFAIVALLWIAYYAVQINQLAGNAEQTMFFNAAGQPWFALEEHRIDVPLDRISPYLQNAIIAVEDRRFFMHSGVDPLAIARASFRNLRSGEIVEGASTLTQQLARLLFLSRSKSFTRKFKETVLASLIELRLSKKQVLELYLNRIYFGGDVYGVETMARNLYGKHAADLSLEESALMAGLIRAPSTLWPWSNSKGAIERSHLVLNLMQEQGFITKEVREAARPAPKILPRPGLDDGPSGYAAQFLRAEFRRRFGDRNPRGWKVYTTFVPELQTAAETAVAGGLKRLRVRNLQSALVAIDPHTGDVLALVGGRDFASTPFNRATTAKRQPGSAFKAFLYAAALEQGMSPISMISGLDELSVAGHDDWTVRNVSHEDVDELTLRDAFLESDNRAAVALQTAIGSKPVLRLSRLVGLGQMPDVPSLALGTGEVTPLELTAAYAVFPNGGMAVVPRGISRVVDDGGSTIFDNPPTPQRVLADAAAFQMVTMLSDVIDRGTGAAARSLGVNFPAGGKTGTTDDFKDAWFVGFSSSVVAGVWAGLDQPAPIASNAYGSRYALPIWSDFMVKAARVRPPQQFVAPPSVKAVSLCSESHLGATAYCVSRTEYFKSADAIPTELCDLHGDHSLEAVLGGFFRGIGRWITR